MIYNVFCNVMKWVSVYKTFTRLEQAPRSYLLGRWGGKQNRATDTYAVDCKYCIASADWPDEASKTSVWD